MKIAINTRFLLPDRLEGIGWYTHEICERLVKLRPDDEFHFLFDRSYDDRFLFGESHITPHKLWPQARHPLLWLLWFETGIPRVIDKEDIDIFISMDGMMSLTAKCPTLMVCHDVAWAHYPGQVPWLVQKYYEYYTPRYLRKAEHVVTVSQFVKKDIAERFDLPSEKLSVAYNGVKEVYKPVEEPAAAEIRQRFTSGKPYFLFIGALHPRKNVHRLIKAYEQFARDSSEIKLVIVGDMSWQTGEIKKSFDNSPVKEDIIFLPYQEQGLLAKITASAFALVYPSLNEGFGVPILEAMTCDVPVITSNCSSMPEVAGKAGLLVDPTSVDSIAQAMTKLSKDKNLRNQLIEEGRSQRQKFSWDASAQHISMLIDQLT